MLRVARENNEVNVGKLIRSIRLERGKSLRALAAETDFSPSFISQVELGQVSPSIASLTRIAAALGVTLGDLFGARKQEVATGKGPALNLGPEEQAALLSVILAHPPDGMAFIDSGFVIRAVNDTYAGQIGLPSSELIGRALDDVFSGWTKQVRSIYEQVRDTGEPFHSEAHPFIFNNQGREREITYWDVSISPVYNSEGSFLGYFLAHRDVTQRRKAEQERERSIAQLRKVNAQLVLSNIPLAGRAE